MFVSLFASSQTGQRQPVDSKRGSTTYHAMESRGVINCTPHFPQLATTVLPTTRAAALVLL